MRDVVVHPLLGRAELAFGGAWTGEAAFTVALSVVAYREGGPAAVGVLALVRMVPSALLSPVLTALADRMRRERVLVAVSLVRALAIGAAALLSGAGTSAAGVYALAVVDAVAFTLFRPVHSALLPSLCTTTRELTSANVVRGIVDSSGALLGPVLAGLLMAASTPAAVFAAAALLSLGAAVALLGVHDGTRRAPATGGTTLARDAADGLCAVARDRDLRLVLGLGFAQTVVRGALNVFVVVVAITQLGTGDAGVAALSAAVGAGGLVGSMAMSLLVGSRHLGRWLAIALVLWGAPIAVLGAGPAAAATLGLLAVVGLGNAIIDVPLFTLPVRLASDAVLARVFGVFESLVALGVGLGGVLTPAVIDLLDLRGALVATGLLLPLLALLSARRLRELDERLGVREGEIDVLRRAPMLNVLPVPSIEHLASRLRHRTFPEAAVVFAQGDPGGAYYVIVDGKADVVGDGALVAVLGPGDSFGEIALVNDVPRTATVKATTALEVFELDRDAFLDAIGSSPATSDAAAAAVARHLANFTPGAVAL